MGLDIVAVSNIEFVTPYDLGRELLDDDDTCRWLWNNPAFPDQFGDRREGIYRVNGETFHFRAGSYSGYNAWRNWLCESFLQVTPAEVWNDPQSYADKPFFELINFSDCEGTIGTDACKELLQDFLKFTPEDDDAFGYNVDRYNEWKKAFEVASDNGAVIFT